MRKKNVVFCLYMLTLLAHVSIEANSVDPDQSYRSLHGLLADQERGDPNTTKNGHSSTHQRNAI